MDKNIKPLISVIMPVYNAERFLPESIESILNQTFKNFEFIIIDDNSHDKTIEVITSYKDKKIKIIENKRNIGISASLNEGIKTAQGKYVARMDADDISLPTRLEEQFLFMEENTDISICGTNIKLFGKNTGTIKHPKLHKDIISKLVFLCPLAHPTVIIRKNIFEKKNASYNDKYYSAQDYELWSSLYPKVKFHNIQKPLLLYRTHENNNSISSKHDFSSEVRKKNLKHLGILPTDKELQLHNELSKNKSVSNTFKFYEVDKWLLALKKQNNKTQIYPTQEFNKYLKELWWNAYNIPDIKNKFYKYFLFSRFHSIKNKLQYFFSIINEKFITRTFPAFIELFLIYFHFSSFFHKRFSPQKGRTVIIASSEPPELIGGVSSAHYNLYSALKNKNEDIHFISYYNRYSSQAYKNEKPINKFQLAITNKLTQWSEIYFARTEPATLAYHTKDIISSAFGASRLMKELRRLKPETIIFPDHMTPAFFFKKNQGTKTIMISHHIPNRFRKIEQLKIYSILDIKLSTKIEQKALKNIDTVICVSEYMKNEFRKTYDYQGRVHVINNLINTELISSVAPKKLNSTDADETKLNIYLPAAGMPLKGKSVLYKLIQVICNEFPDKKFSFYINNTIDENLLLDLKLISKNISFFTPGYIPYDENIAYLKSCHFGISPTYAESFGMAILEANYCGVPMICHNIDAVPEIIKDGTNGYLVDIDDTGKITHCMKQYINTTDWKETKRNCIEYVQDKFNPDKIVKQYLKLFSETRTT